MTTPLSAGQVRRARWQSLALDGDRISSVPAVIDRLGAQQGQDLPGALLSLALRVHGADLRDVRRHFDTKTLVRGWPMRGTLHVVRAEDLLPLTQITRPRVLRRLAAQSRALNITEATVETISHAVADELRRVGAVTRSDLREIVAGAHQNEPDSAVVALLISHLSTRGLICHGPFRGDTHLIVHTEAWLGSRAAPDPDTFLARMLTRYVRGHGPVTERDAARWFGLPLTMIRDARHALGDALIEVPTPQGRQWMVAEEKTERILATLKRRPRVRLLPGFDEFMLGYADRSFAVPPAMLSAIVPGGNGMFRPTVCSGASVVGTWSRPPTGTQLRVFPFAPLAPSTQAGIRTAARELTRITGNQVTPQLPH